MKKILCLAVVLVALLAYAPPRAADAQGCWSGDWDGDGTCAIYDCDDTDPAITITQCKLSRQQYPVVYNPPEQTCREGIQVTRCFPNGYCYVDVYLRYCD